MLPSDSPLLVLGWNFLMSFPNSGGKHGIGHGQYCPYDLPTGEYLPCCDSVPLDRLKVLPFTGFWIGTVWSEGIWDACIV